MTAYKELIDGALKSDKYSYIPVNSAIYIRAMEEVNSGDSEIVPFTEEDLDPSLALDNTISNMTHDFGDGRVINVRHPSFSNDEVVIRNALEVMNRHGLPSIPWAMVDGTFAPVTAAELQTALESGQDQTLSAWSAYIASTP